jgi:hypothetical protein
LLRRSLEPFSEFKILLGRQSFAVEDVIFVSALVRQSVLLFLFQGVRWQRLGAVWQVVGANGVGGAGVVNDGEMLDCAVKVIRSVNFLSEENDSVRFELGLVS